MKLFAVMAARIQIVKELMVFFWDNKLWWLIPLVTVIVVFGAFLVFTQTSPLAPFIYALF